MGRFESARDLDHRLDLVDRGHLGQGQHETVGQPARAGQLADEQVQRPQAPPPGGPLQILEPDAEERRGGPRLDGLPEIAGGVHRGRVLLVVRTRSVAVLEVDAQVLDRLGLELLDHPGVDRLHICRIGADRGGQLVGGPAVRAERLPSLPSPFLSQVRGERVGGDVHRVHGLAHPSIAGVQLGQPLIGRCQSVVHPVRDVVVEAHRITFAALRCSGISGSPRRPEA